MQCILPICGTTLNKEGIPFMKKYPLLSANTQFHCNVSSDIVLLVDRPLDDTSIESRVLASDSWVFEDQIEEGYMGLHSEGDIAILVQIRFDIFDGDNSLLMSIDNQKTSPVIGGTVPRYRFVSEGKSCDSLYVKANAALCYEYANASNLSFVMSSSNGVYDETITQ
eukprot:3355897-Pleurochrysis_carterae.AAC.1